MRTTLDQNPHDLALAIALAQGYVNSGKTQADPRYYGYAQGVLNPWWNLQDPPTEILLLRASILQFRHDFSDALADLNKVLERDPANARAWLARAAILLVQADYPEAQRSCLPLLELDDPLSAAACLSQIGSLTGHAAESFVLLRDAFAHAPRPSDDQRYWILTLLGTMSFQLDQDQDAGRFYKQAIALRGEDVYLLGVYADFLLDQDRAGEVVSLLRDQTRVDPLLLRLALAKQRLGSEDLAGLASVLEQRFAVSRLRGESLHQGDEARFRLFLLNQPQPALRLAQANWKVQREPKDMRILLEAALAAENPSAAKPALELIARTSLEHPRIQALAARLRALESH